MELLFLLIFWLIFSLLVGHLAASWGRSKGTYILRSLLFSPLLALLILLIQGKKEVNVLIATAGLVRCPFCAEFIQPLAIKCRYCGSEIKRTPAPQPATQARVGYAPRIGPPPGTSKAPAMVAGTVGLAVLVMIVVFSVAPKPQKPPEAAPPAPVITDDAALLISRYGPPDVDDSTQYDKPRPPFPTRWLVYKKERVRANYLPDGKLGDSPPYRWKLLGFTDPRTKQPLRLEQVRQRMRQREKSRP
jgi:hypothetical protein